MRSSMSSSGTGDDAGEARLRPGRRGPRRGTAGATARAAGAPGQGRRRRARLVQAGARRVPGPSVPHLEVPDDGPGRRAARGAPDRGAWASGYAARATVWSDLRVILKTLRHLYWSAAGIQLTAPLGRADPAVDSRSTPRSDRGRSAASAATIPRTNQNCLR